MASTPPPSARAFAATPSSAAYTPSASSAYAHRTPSSSSASSSRAPPPPAELDTTMEDAEEEDDDAPPPDDEFAFNAPTFYDLKHPERERQYVNNADGYFFSTPQRAPPPPLSAPPHSAPPHSAPPLSATAVTPQTPFGRFREPPAHSEDSDTEMADDQDDDRMSDGGRSDDTLVLESLVTPPKSAPASSFSSSTTSPSAALPPPPVHRSLGHSHSSHASAAVSSSLLQPTKSFLLRMQAEQAERERVHLAEHHSSSHETKQPTHARSPQLRTSQRQHTSNEPKLSSTSRELQKIQEEKTRVQLETLKVREYHERVRSQRVPSNVHQRSTKQLTIPQSPYLEVGHRSRRAFNQSMTSSEEGEQHDRDAPHPYIPPEQFLSRDFEFPASHRSGHQQQSGPHDVTVPHTPQLRTSERAARRNVFPHEEPTEQPVHRVDYSKMKVNGVTRPISPQFETDRRAAQAASYRKPMEVVDQDGEELHRKFHARPVPRQVFEAPKRASPQKTTRPALTKPVSPKLSTSARARFHAPEELRDEKKALSSSCNGPRRTGPTVAETPPLRSLQRHQMYQENLRRRQEAEEEDMRRLREFKAQPLRVTTTPPKFEGSKKPLTEVQPFSLRGEHFHERAQERLERKRRQEEEKLRASANFRAMPMPDLAASDDETTARQVAPPPVRSLTKPSSPKFALNRRAAERATFEAAERERRARDEEEKRRADEEKRRLEEDEIKRMRREQLTFHARPVPVPRAFALKPSTRSLTEPESPFLQTKVRGGSATTAA